MATEDKSKVMMPVTVRGITTDIDGKEVLVYAKVHHVENNYYFVKSSEIDIAMNELKNRIRWEMVIVVPGKDDLGE